MSSTRTNKNISAQKTMYLITILLKGIGQIMLQENAITGLLFLVAIFHGSFVMGFAALLATVCGTATAFLLKYEQSEIEKGFYGFSAALVGVGVMLFLKPVVLSWIFVVFGSALASVIQNFFIKRKIPVFTLPFVLVTWLIILVGRMYLPHIMSEPSLFTATTIDYLRVGFKGYGQVIFQADLISGLLFFIAVLVSSPIAAVYGFAGAILSAVVASQLSVPINGISMGLFSYNGVLCAIVFAGTQIKDGVWVLISVLLSLFITIFMAKFGIIALTFPFVLASFLTLVLRNKPKLVINQQN